MKQESLSFTGERFKGFLVAGDYFPSTKKCYACGTLNEMQLSMLVYFVDPGKPYQRGGNENTNGLIRQFFPKKTDLSSLSLSEVKTVQNRLDARPRKRLAYANPQEIFEKALGDKNLTRFESLGR